jgi:hypothetical protein
VDQNAFDFEAICRSVGRLYLTSTRDLDRCQAVYEVRQKQLQGQLDAALQRQTELERELHDLRRSQRHETA